MQTPYADPTTPTSLFSRERRRQRMLHFLAEFEKRPSSSGREFPFFLPLSRPEGSSLQHEPNRSSRALQGTEVTAA